MIFRSMLVLAISGSLAVLASAQPAAQELPAGGKQQVDTAIAKLPASSATPAAATPETPELAGVRRFMMDWSRTEQTLTNRQDRRDRAIARQEELAAAKSQLPALRTRLAALRTEWGKLDCLRNPAGARNLLDEKSSLAETLSSITNELMGVYSWESDAGAGPFPRKDMVGTGLDCDADKQLQLAALSRWDGNLGKLEGDIDGGLADARRDAAEHERQIAELRMQQASILTDMQARFAAKSVTDDLIWILLIIFGLGIGVMASVKVFPQGIQMELISSGQIIQFVTVLVLLGIFMALGLAERLQEETLGTLLGGVAGYVLSQGIGRQERHRALGETKPALTGPATPPALPAPAE